MTFDWSVVWHNAGALLEGIELTVLLAVTTMVISIPGGIVLALMRLSNVRALSAASAPSSSTMPIRAIMTGCRMGTSTTGTSSGRSRRCSQSHNVLPVNPVHAHGTV